MISAPVFRARGVSVSFGGVRAVDGVDLELSPGQVTGLSDDMRQRFRVVSERLGDIDRRLAA